MQPLKTLMHMQETKMAEAAKTAVKTGRKEEAGAGALAPVEEGRWSPFTTLRSEIDRLFDEFAWPSLRAGRRLFEPEPLWRGGVAWGAVPPVEIVEKDNGYQVTAELPGLGEKDVDVSLTEDLLTIKGEKKDEIAEEKKGYHMSERRYGTFQRSFRLPSGVDRDKIEAHFDKGVLTIILPKTAEAQKKERKIQVKGT
jgi:HSP20 family protein